MASLAWDAFRQCFFIPQPPLTEKNLPDQSGRVFIVTGGYAGVGKELCKMLYGKNGTVYMASRSQGKFDDAAAELKKAHPNSDGKLEFLKVDLSDLASIKPAVEEFTTKEQRLDVLTNNAGVMAPPNGSKSAQGHELQMGTNVLGPFLLTSLLTPLLQKTAASSPPGATRVTWAASMATLQAPKGGVEFEANGDAKFQPAKWDGYGQSKASNSLLSYEYQKRVGDQAKIVSHSWNPGNLYSELQRHQPGWMDIFFRMLTYPPYMGGYTELFAGWSEEAGKPEHRGKYVVPWGRFGMLRQDILENEEGASKLWEYCEKETKAYR